MNAFTAAIHRTLDPLRQQILQHSAYAAIGDTADLGLFMQHHVYAVWDFMSLLKALQQQLTGHTVPWFPVGNGDTRYLIHEIVIGEDADVDKDGVRKSHFEMYLEAMEDCGADTTSIRTFVEHLQRHGDLEAAFAVAQTPDAARAFVRATFGVIAAGKPHTLAAVFTFGREDLIPAMFHAIVTDLQRQAPAAVARFRYYLERHIEVDGGHHSQLALQMVAQLCGDEATHWAEAEAAAAEALRQRLLLWDGIHAALTAKVTE